MAVGVLVILVVLATLLAWRGRRRVAGGFAIAAVVWLLLAGCGVLPAWLLDRLQAPYVTRPVVAWAPSNVIVLLGAGNDPLPAHAAGPTLFGDSRILETALLYRQCKAVQERVCRVLVSGGDATHTGHSEAEIYGDLLLRLGVAAADLQREPRSMNTWQNAQFSRPILAADRAGQVVMVSSAWHLPRARLYFAHFGLNPLPVRADLLRAHPGWWPQAQNLLLTDLAWHEYAGVLRYRVYEAMGWNAAAVKPGAP